MQIRCVREVGRSRLRELEEKRLRLILNAQIVVHGPQIAVEAASEGAHGQVDAVGRCARGVRDRDRGGVERKGVALNTWSESSWLLSRAIARHTDSKTFTAYLSRPSCLSRWAVTSPAMPEPTTATLACRCESMFRVGS
jgi:hypothetical protein